MLSKLPRTTFIAGTPEIPYRPAETVCTPPPEQGSWQWTCRRYEIEDFGGNVPPGGQIVYVYGDELDPLTQQPVVVDVYIMVCASEWVPDNSGGPSSPVCVFYPEQPYVPGQPPRFETVSSFSWDAGANSIDELSGDVYTRMTNDLDVGLVVGFITDRDLPVTDRTRILFGFYFHTNQSGDLLCDIIEAGRVIGDTFSYTPTTELEIRRIGDVVQYFFDGELLYTSSNTTSADLSVGASMYGSGDGL